MAKILGNKHVGFCNTVPMFNDSKKAYGVWNVEEQKFVANTPWDDNPNLVIEKYDDMVMLKSSVTTAPTKKTAIVRERGGDKAKVAKEVFEKYPNLKTQELIDMANRLHNGVTRANWQYLFAKLQGKR